MGWLVTGLVMDLSRQNKSQPGRVSYLHGRRLDRGNGKRKLVQPRVGRSLPILGKDRVGSQRGECQRVEDRGDHGDQKE